MQRFLSISVDMQIAIIAIVPQIAIAVIILFAILFY